MNKSGMKVMSRFDAYDSLENEEDLLILYETLTSVKDKNGNPAVFTALSVPVNIDFERMESTNYNQYYYELLPQTLSKLKRHQRVWDLWKEGITSKILFPQFHGREHLNLKVFSENLLRRDPITLNALRNRSYTSITSNHYPNISYTAAFHFEEFEEIKSHEEIIRDGLNRFEEVFGFRSECFNPPGGREHQSIHSFLADNGIKYIECPLIKNEHQGGGKYKKKIYYTGKKNILNQLFLVRNCVFEPTYKARNDWVQYCLKQIEISFKWNRPANISSHRVNFCGHIDTKNRSKGILALKQLLKEIVKKWPEVEFMTTNDLAKLVSDQNEF